MNTTINRALIIAAHPDDETLGCGGTIRRILSEGGAVRVCILGEGTTARYPAARRASPEALAEMAQRRSFADRALDVLGVTDAVFGDLPCAQFDQVPILEIQHMIEQQIREFQPDTLFTHFGQDTNSDHRITFNAAMIATRPLPGYPVRTVLCFETLSSTEWRFVDSFPPSLFIDIDAHIDAKAAAFECYAPTEARAFPFPRCDEGVRLQARMRGMQVGLAHAEAFQVVRSIATAR